MAYYCQSDYWEERYRGDSDPFEWYQDYMALRPFFKKYVPDKISPILQVGCGSSHLAEDLFKDGYQNISNIDISYTVIKQMVDRMKEQLLTGIYFRQMNVKGMKFGEGEFDCVIDKACFDAQCVGENHQNNSEAFLKEVYRVLGPSGVFICVSYASPDKRMKFFDSEDPDGEKKFNWKIIHKKIPKLGIPTSGKQLTDDEVE